MESSLSGRAHVNSTLIIWESKLRTTVRGPTPMPTSSVTLPRFPCQRAPGCDVAMYEFIRKVQVEDQVWLE